MRLTERVIDDNGVEHIFTKYVKDNGKLKDKKLCDLEDIEDKYNIKSIDELDKKLKALEIIIRTAFPRGIEVIDNGNKEINIYNSPYYLRVFTDDYIYDDYPLQNKEEYDLLKEVLL